MDKYAKEVYKFVLSQPDHSFIYQMYPEQIPGGINKFNDFKAACRFLANKGYAIVGSPGMITLTHEGVHKRELELVEFRKLIFTHYIPGFISGVFVSVTAGLLLQWILLTFCR